MFRFFVRTSHRKLVAWPTRRIEVALQFLPGKPRSVWPLLSGNKSSLHFPLAGSVVSFGCSLVMVRPVKLYCSLARFTASFLSSEFLDKIWRQFEFSTFVMRHLDWKQFFLFQGAVWQHSWIGMTWHLQLLRTGCNYQHHCQLGPCRLLQCRCQSWISRCPQIRIRAQTTNLSQ